MRRAYSGFRGAPMGIASWVYRNLIPIGSMAIRIARESDAEEICRIYAPIVAETSISFEIEIPSIEEMRGRIRTVLSQYPWLVDEREGQLRGYAYASTHRTRSAYQWTAEVTVYVDEEARGKGVGKVLYQILFEVLRKQGYRTAVGGITLPNAASVAVHESVGFEKVAHFKSLGYKFGAWHDVGFWELQLQPYIVDPPAPVPVSALGVGALSFMDTF